jgi:hypothetical protein
VADAARLEPDERLARSGLGQVEILDDKRLSEFLEDCGADLHARHRNRKKAPDVPVCRACAASRS